MSVYQQINTFLVDVFGRINKIEQRALTTGLDADISVTEIHILEKIGDIGCGRMSDIARALGITLATLTVACERLEHEELISRIRADTDRRVVLVSLTGKGQAAYQYHRQFHHDLIDSILADMSEQEQQALSRALGKIEGFLSTY